MPQMAPMNWLTLMIYFSMIFMLFNSTIYFNFLYSTKTMKVSLKTINNIWKW